MRNAIFVTCLLFASAVAGDTSYYLCEADKATGFKYKDGSWKSTNFNVSKHRYVLRRPKQGDTFKSSAWVWSQLGEDFALAGCTNEANEDGFIYCAGYENLLLNTKSLRYQSYYSLGYVTSDGSNTSGDTPYIEIGHCSEM